MGARSGAGRPARRRGRRAPRRSRAARVRGGRARGVYILYAPAVAGGRAERARERERVPGERERARKRA